MELWGKYDDPTKDIDRIITTCREPGELAAYLNPPKKKRKRYNVYKDEKQLKIE